MSRPSWIGYNLGGRYKIEALLGQGGMSAVYRAQDPNLRRTVAVKLIHSHLSADPEFVRRFEAEAAAVAQLRHPHIVQVYDFNHDEDVYYMVMEYLPGESLQTRLKNLAVAGQRFSLQDTADIIARVADAVAYAHGRGTVHRDLKPANVMLMPQDQPVLTDFGVAKILGAQQHTATGAVVGTPAYMSPEQVRGEALDGRADIYSLGVMLYEMAAGHPPFEGDSAMTVMLKHVNEPVPDIRRQVVDAPADFISLVDRALAKQPADRIQTAAELAAALRATVRQLPGGTAMVARPPEAALNATQLVATDTQPMIMGTQRMAPVENATANATMIDPLANRPRPNPPSGPPPLAPPLPAAAPRRSPPWALLAGAAIVMLLCLVIGGGAAVVISQMGLFGGVATATPKATAVPTQGGPTEPATRAAPTSGPLVTKVPLATDTQAATEIPTLEATATATPIEVPPGMVLVPAGTFNMGAGESGDTAPIHAVTLDSFFMDQLEVTNALYGQCVAAGQCSPPTRRSTETRSGYFTDPAFANFPMVNLTWDQAEAFCESDGRRLPTEAEWEYAATGGNARLFPWGDQFDPNLAPVNEPDTVAVGSFPGGASPFGVQDMA
ncbi:MAG: bifunctional serine/threonine-protein kinase/formylglycine-generating enzyme family protein, partial [Anaerolineales bacterium]